MVFHVFLFFATIAYCIEELRLIYCLPAIPNHLRLRSIYLLESIFLKKVNFEKINFEKVNYFLMFGSIMKNKLKNIF